MEGQTKTEAFIKAVVNRFFKLRFLILLLGFGGITWIAIVVGNHPNSTVKDVVEVITAGIIILTLFYNMINYENEQMKFKHDVKIFREKLSFNTATDWHKPPMVDYSKTLKKFLNKCKPLLEDNDSKKFHETIESESNEDEKQALIAVFNFFESIAIAVNQGIMDEGFIKKFFRSIFVQYYQDYSFYIDYRRRIKKSSTMWINFTNLASTWVEC